MVAKQYSQKALSCVPFHKFIHRFDYPILGDKGNPSLVIASLDYVPKNTKGWYLAQQDFGGFNCDLQIAVIKPLLIRESIKKDLMEIVNDNFANDIKLKYFGVFAWMDKKGIRKNYLRAIEKIGLSCQKKICKEHLVQALYPVDLTNANLQLLSSENVNKDDFNSIKGRVVLFIVGESSESTIQL